MISFRPKVNASLVLAALAAGCSSGSSSPTTTGALVPDQANQATSNDQRFDGWRKSMTSTTLSKAGCFQVSYPDTAWAEVPCTTAPNAPHMLPAPGGNGAEGEGGP